MMADVYLEFGKWCLDALLTYPRQDREKLVRDIIILRKPDTQLFEQNFKFAVDNTKNEKDSSIETQYNDITDKTTIIGAFAIKARTLGFVKRPSQEDRRLLIEIEEDTLVPNLYNYSSKNLKKVILDIRVSAGMIVTLPPEGLDYNRLSETMMISVVAGGANDDNDDDDAYAASDMKETDNGVKTNQQFIPMRFIGNKRPRPKACKYDRMFYGSQDELHTPVDYKLMIYMTTDPNVFEEMDVYRAAEHLEVIHKDTSRPYINVDDDDDDDERTMRNMQSEVIKNKHLKGTSIHLRDRKMSNETNRDTTIISRYRHKPYSKTKMMSPDK